jgi:PLD-like domain
MKTQFVTHHIWKSLTASAKAARKPSLVAVAYFGQGASKLLPLRAGSRLVVDASEGAVKSGQTHPADLKRLQKRGVVIYSYPSLHAKVYAFDGFAFIGSANASNRSSGILREAVVKTSDQEVVRSAKTFIRDLCRDELSPGRLDRLQKMYRPPRVPRGPKAREKAHSQQPRQTMPRLFLAQLKLKDIPEGSEGASEQGMKIAKTRRKHGRSYVLDDYFSVGKNIIQEGDKVIQILERPDGSRLIDAPADVLYTRLWKGSRYPVTFIYLEHPDIRRIRLDKLARRLGYGAKKKLHRDGLVRDREFAEKLLANWSQF